MECYCGLNPLLDVTIAAIRTHVDRFGDGSKTIFLTLISFMRQLRKVACQEGVGGGGVSAAAAAALALRSPSAAKVRCLLRAQLAKLKDKLILQIREEFQ